MSSAGRAEHEEEPSATIEQLSELHSLLDRLQRRVADLERDVVLLQEASAAAKTPYAEGADASDVDQLRRQLDADLKALQASVVRAAAETWVRQRRRTFSRAGGSLRSNGLLGQLRELDTRLALFDADRIGTAAATSGACWV